MDNQVELIINSNLPPRFKVYEYLKWHDDCTPEEFDRFIVRLATYEWLIKEMKHDTAKD